MDTYKKTDLFLKVLGLIGIIVSIFMLFAYKEKAYQDNERARRELSLNLIRNSDKVGIGRFCIQFLADMSRDEITKIFKFDELDINDAHMDKLTSCLAGQKESDLLNKSQKPAKLTKNGSYYVNYQATLHMDELESIASAYYSDVADENIIKKYFDTSLKFQPILVFIDKLNPSGQKNYINLEKYIRESTEKAS